MEQCLEESDCRACVHSKLLIWILLATSVIFWG